jgi:hypothetical protein
MMTKFILASFFGLFSLVSLASGSEELGMPEDTVNFFTQAQGRYQILIAADHVPKEDNKYGYVSLEGDEGLIALPYCHKTGNVCDPGFRSFPLSETQIYKKTLEPGDDVFTLIRTENETTYRYTWEIRNEIVHFLDSQYTLANGESFPLEFIMERAPEPHKPVQP